MPSIELDFQKPIDHLQQELQTIRAGRATPELVEQLSVATYGQRMPLQQLASIATSDSRTLLIQPWDANTLKDIEKSILASDLGMTPVVDGKSIRLMLPQLTAERREEFVRVVKKKSEEAKVSLRKIREEAMRDLKDAQKAGGITEDDLQRQTKDIQKKLDERIATVDEIATKKTEEIMTV